MKIFIANPHGFCGNDQGFGVARAIYLASKASKKNPGKTYLLGDIVHNKKVVWDLEKKYGIITVDKIMQIPAGSTVVIRSHGASPNIYFQLKKRQLNIVDATCPIVAEVHKEVKRLSSLNKKIIYICSEKTHDEAIGVKSQVPKAVKLITLKELLSLKINNPKDTVILTQTTLAIWETKNILSKLKQKYPDLTIKPHICMATTKRQKAVMDLAKKVDLMIIVGSQTSSNSKRLQEAALSAGAKAYLINDLQEINKNWFKGAKKIGISSGASTPEWLLNEIVEVIRKW